MNEFPFTRVAHNSHSTNKPVALGFQIELEFGNIGFCGLRKIGELGEKPRCYMANGKCELAFPFGILLLSS